VDDEADEGEGKKQRNPVHIKVAFQWRWTCPLLRDVVGHAKIDDFEK